MTKTIEQTVSMLEMLPAQEQNFALEFVKRLVLAWDPDYTKLTPSERTKLEKAENGEYIKMCIRDRPIAAAYCLIKLLVAVR